MSMVPTKEQCESECQKLLEMLPRVRRYSAFGDDHHEAIRAVIQILEGTADAEDFEDAADNVRDEAYAAEAWMQGEAYEDYSSPSETWKELVQQ